MLEPIKKESVRGQVFWQLRNPILRRTWPPDSKLPSENELSRAIGVSRGSIREGIRKEPGLHVDPVSHAGPKIGNALLGEFRATVKKAG